jgi:hypothetical protein
MPLVFSLEFHDGLKKERQLIDLLQTQVKPAQSSVAVVDTSAHALWMRDVHTASGFRDGHSIERTSYSEFRPPSLTRAW